MALDDRVLYLVYSFYPLRRGRHLIIDIYIEYRHCAEFLCCAPAPYEALVINHYTNFNTILVLHMALTDKPKLNHIL